MTPAGDVIVVGAGIIGCAIGRELARRGVSVRIFEGRTIGGGATHASAGVLAPYIEAHEHPALFELTIRSLEMYDAFVQEVTHESGIDIEYRRCGTLQIADDAATAGKLQEAVLAGPDGGAMRWLSAADARSLEPALPPTIAGAVLVGTHGYVAAPPLTEALAWAALRHGARIEATDRIVAVRQDGANPLVETADGQIWPARQVIVAAGSWSGQIEGVGLREGALRPLRGQLLHLHWPGPPLRHVLWGPECYIVPWRDGRLLVGATVEDVGFDERATAAGVRDLLDAACELLPEAWRATFIEARVGLRPATRDGLPLVGPSPSAPGVIYATGHFRNGILLAPLTARLVADLVTEGTADPLLARMDPGR